MLRAQRNVTARGFPDSRVTGEEPGAASQPVGENPLSCTAGDDVACHCAANRCNGSLQVVAPADFVAKTLEQVLAVWVSEHDGRRLRRDLLALLAELDD
jgi:hypothetical protein